MLNISIVLYHPNWEQEVLPLVEELLRVRCLRKIFLLDNSETREIHPKLEIKHPKLRYMHMPANLGYGKAHNVALRESAYYKTDLHLVMNSDILVKAEDIDAMHDWMLANPQVGQLMPRVLNPDGTQQYLAKRLPSPLDVFGRRFLPKWMMAKRNRRYELRDLDLERPINAPYLSGCFMLLRTKAAVESGLFDERYFMYPEDIDLTRSIHRNYLTLYYPQWSIIHAHAKESYTNKSMLKIHIRNMCRYFNKWGWIFDKERRAMNKILTFVILILSLCCCSTLKVQPKVSARVLNYTSIDQHGAPLVISGKVTIPEEKQPRGIMLVPHGTYTGNHEVPSNKTMYEERLYGSDYVLVMPDYIGYGITQDSLHPYLCGELTAQNCVDMLLAVRDLLDSMHLNMQTDSITIVGYSQGAASALWTMKLLEEHYADQLPVKACFAGSGPYDVASEFDVCIQKNRTGMPVTVPMLTMGTSMGYDLHLNPADFFTPAAERMYRNYVLKKKYGFVAVYFRTPNHRLSYWLTTNGRDKSQPATQRIYEGLLQSSLIHYPVDSHPMGQQIICTSWRPKAPTYIFHSTNDDVVGFQNSEHLQRCWNQIPSVTYDFGKYGGHMKSLQLFVKRVREQLDLQ